MLDYVIVVKCILTQIEFLISEVLIENYAGCFETKAPMSTITTEYFEVKKNDSARECVVKCRGKSDYFGLNSVIKTFKRCLNIVFEVRTVTESQCISKFIGIKFLWTKVKVCLNGILTSKLFLG